MHIKSVYVEGFKSFSTGQTIDFNENLNVVIGRNGSGKSNLFHAISFAILGNAVRFGTSPGSEIRRIKSVRIGLKSKPSNFFYYSFRRKSGDRFYTRVPVPGRKAP